MNTKGCKKGTCEVGDKVYHKNRLILVQKVLGYCPEMRKSYIKGCAISEGGKHLLRVNILAGYDWEFKKSF